MFGHITGTAAKSDGSGSVYRIESVKIVDFETMVAQSGNTSDAGKS